MYDLRRRHRFILAVPLLLWFTLFQFGTMVPPDWRPEINVQTLPFLERALFGSVFTAVVETTNDSFVLLAAVPYLLHFAIPWIFTVYLWKIDGKPFTFLWCMGILNTASVLTHLFVPTAPPWYLEKYGLETPADYSMKGDPGRLAEADEILSIPLFKHLYGNNPIVFGSFPSLHAAWPFLIAIFMPETRIKWAYVCWVWWAALYLKHHYFLDVIGGAIYTLVVLLMARQILHHEFDLPSLSIRRKKQHVEDLEIC